MTMENMNHVVSQKV